MPTQNTIKGRYRHYKGKDYDLIGIAKHSENLEDFVIYKPLYGQNLAEYWIRPKDMFFGDVEIDGKKMKRFSLIKLYDE